MSIAKLGLTVFKSLSKQGIKPICRSIGGKTAVSFTRNGKNYTQLYNAEGKLLKFKINDKTTGKITKSEFYRTKDSLSIDRFDKDILGTEKTKIFKMDDGILMEKKGGFWGDEVTSIHGKNEFLDDGTYGFKGFIKRDGGLKPIFKEYGNKPLIDEPILPLNNNYSNYELPALPTTPEAPVSDVPYWQYAAGALGLFGLGALVFGHNKKKEETPNFQCNATPPSMRG